jgi:hypothetical protein
MGCEQIPSTGEELEKTFQDAKSKVESLTPSRRDIEGLASGEIEKLFTIEYKIIEVPKEDTALQIEESLSQYGRKRWECFHVDASGEYLRFFCKRRTKSYLRYIGSVL